MPTPKRSTRRKLAPLLLPAFVVAAAVAALVTMRSGPTDAKTAAAAIRHKLEAADAASVAGPIDQLRAAGAAGLVELIAAADSPHAHVAAAAAAAVDRQLVDWESSDAAIRSRSAIEVAALLAERSEHLAQPARRVAATVAQRLLLWPTTAALDHSEFVVNCETILLAAEAPPPEALADADADDDDFAPPSRELDPALLDRSNQPAAPPIAQVASATLAKPRTVDDDVLSAVTLPGGDLPVNSREPAVTLPVERPTPAEEKMPEPRLFLDGDVDKLPTEQLVPPDDDAKSHGAKSHAANSADAPSFSNTATSKATGIVKTSGAQTAGAASRTKLQTEPLALDREHSLLRLLNDAPEVAGEAEAALRAAGYDDDSLAVARRATSEDRGTRLRLAEALPTLPGVSARLWLEFLLDDEDADVRRAAFSQLATTGDRILLDRLRRRASEDPDEAIRALGSRLK